jgi:Methyltransferase domain
MPDLNRHPAFAEIDRLLDGPEPDEAGWYAAMRALLERAYLASDDPYAQSGMAGDAARWERGRRPIVDAIGRDGTLLDVGCANGLLMESLQAWAAAAGHRIEPYGLDYSAGIADMARRRLPHWAQRVFDGNIIDWRPPFQFDFVRTELEYVPPRRQASLVARLLREVVKPGGRLIVCSYGSARRPAPRAADVAAILRDWGYSPLGESRGRDENGVVITCVAWIDASAD